MKTLILNGSPRPQGDTASLIRVLTAQLEGDYRLVDAYRCRIAPCVDCRYCWTHLGCAIEDKMQELYRYIEDCDNVLIASPVYFSELTGKLLDLCSRLQMYFGAARMQKVRLLTKPKRGAIILVGGGLGSIDRAAETAQLLLRQLKCSEIAPLVSSHDTDHVPAAEDAEALRGAREIAAWFNRCDTTEFE